MNHIHTSDLRTVFCYPKLNATQTGIPSVVGVSQMLGGGGEEVEEMWGLRPVMGEGEKV